jgi:HD-GYP domain-containing protein (c-di-GMP phosphodiesterase class II)
VCLIAKQHQECSDGSGYPDKLTDEQISYGAKLVHIADVYEAMCAARCYRGPMERTRVRSVMMYESHKYNKDLLETFMEEVPLYMLNDVICYKDRIYKVVGYTETKYPLVVDIFTNKEYDLSEFNPAFIEPVDLILKVGDET